MRLFIAIELPEEVKHKLAGMQRDISGVRWVAPDQLHLTLLFLGEVAEDTLEQLVTTLSEIRVNPFELEICGTGCFPLIRTPRILWVGFKNQPKLDRLVKLIRNAAESCGILLEKRRFSPHITLARVKQPGAGDVSCFLNQSLSDKFQRFEIRQFVLFQSVINQQGVIHRPIRIFT